MAKIAFYTLGCKVNQADTDGKPVFAQRASACQFRRRS